MKTGFFSFLFLKKFFKKNFRDFLKSFLQFFLIIAIFWCGIENAFAQANATESWNNAQTWPQYTDKNGNPSFSSTGFTIDLSTLDPIQRSVKTDKDGNKIQTSNNPVGLFTKIMESISNLLLFIIPILAGVSLIIAGYFYIFSFSDGELQTKAKNIVKYNIMAMGIAFLSYVIISIIAGFFK